MQWTIGLTGYQTIGLTDYRANELMN